MIAMGPGLGRTPETEATVQQALKEFAQPMVIDADALTGEIRGEGRVRVLTPHPGEMARISGKSAAEIAKDRVGVARAFACEHGVTLVLKGHRTAIAFPDGRVWIIYGMTGRWHRRNGRRAHRHDRGISRAVRGETGSRSCSSGLFARARRTDRRARPG